MRSIPPLFVVLLVIIAGCSAIPFNEPAPQEASAPVIIINNATQIERFTVAVADRGKDIHVVRSNNNTANYTIDQGGATVENPREYPFIEVTFPESARVQGEYTLEPGERKQINVTNLTSTEAIVITIFDEEDQSYRAIHTVSCKSTILGIRAISQSGGSEDWTIGTHQCG